MEFERDYILRIVRQVSSALTHILRLREAGRDEEALALIAESYGQLSGLSPSLVHALAEDDLVELLRARGTLDPRRCLALAELLREEGDLYEDRDDFDESYPRYLKSLRLFIEVAGELVEAGVLVTATGLDAVVARLDSYEVPRSVSERLLRHYESLGEYAKAEDLVWELIEADDGDPAAIAMARGLYARLLGRSDEDLVAGELPRDEVEEGLARLAHVAEPA